MVGAGLWLNVRMGPSPLHYVMAMMAAVAGLAVSFWQVVGISLTRQSGYGATLMGWQIDTWAVVTFGVLFLFSAFMLAWDRKWGDNNLKRPFPKWGGALAALFLVAILLNAASVVAACGASACPAPDARVQMLSANVAALL